MSVLNDGAAVTVEEVTREEGRELFERACQRELGVSAEEFIESYDEGSVSPEWSAQSVQRLEFLLPFAR